MEETNEKVNLYGEVIESIAKAFDAEPEKEKPESKSMDTPVTLEGLMKALQAGKSSEGDEHVSKIAHRESPIEKSRDAIAQMFGGK